MPDLYEANAMVTPVRGAADLALMCPRPYPVRGDSLNAISELSSGKWGMAQYVGPACHERALHDSEDCPGCNPHREEHAHESQSPATEVLEEPDHWA